MSHGDSLYSLDSWTGSEWDDESIQSSPQRHEPRSSDLGHFPKPPLSWTPPRLGLHVSIDSPDSFDCSPKRTKRKLSEQITEPASDLLWRGRCLRIKADLSWQEVNRLEAQAAEKVQAAEVNAQAAEKVQLKQQLQKAVRVEWSPAAFSLCDDSPIHSVLAQTPQRPFATQRPFAPSRT